MHDSGNGTTSSLSETVPSAESTCSDIGNSNVTHSKSENVGTCCSKSDTSLSDGGTDDVDNDDDSDDNFLMNEYEAQNPNPPYTVMAFEHIENIEAPAYINFHGE
eukprot:39302_1